MVLDPRLERFKNPELWKEILQLCEESKNPETGREYSISIKVVYGHGHATWGVDSIDGKYLLIQGHFDLVPHSLQGLLPCVREIYMVGSDYKNGRSIVTGRVYPYPYFSENGSGPGIDDGAVDIDSVITKLENGRYKYTIKSDLDSDF